MLAPISLSVLLASILFTPAEAVPTPRNVGLVTLPLTRMHKARNDVHPQIVGATLLQQHANRAHRRLARMTGKREPTKEEMSAAIQKRMVIVGDGVEALRNKQTQKRKYTVGKVDSELSRIREGANVAAVVNVAANAGGNGLILTTITTTVTAAPAQSTSAAGAKSTVTEFVTVTAGAPGSSAPAEAVSSTSTSSASSSTATAGAGNGTSTGSNKDGFSQVDLDAAIKGGLTNATAPTADNSIGLQDEANDVGYIAELQLGNPPRSFKLLMDSGSADMWVGGEQCKSLQGGGCGNHNFLGNQSSSSFKSLGKTFQVTYGTGQVAGDIITDDVSIAGLKLPAHTFGVATVESKEFSSNDTPFDGLVGLAQSTLSNQKVPTPPESLAKAGLLHLWNKRHSSNVSQQYQSP
ncbi:hypothetical protein FRC07_006946 [Ceratobasidium sp. 392]|nr:hypothetical protein FRC07_006946 [Ceratobasidium sp. 392]